MIHGRRSWLMFAAVSIALTGCQQAPLNYVTASGAASRPTVHLNWGLSFVSCAVIVIITVLLIAAIVRRRAPARSPDEVTRGGRGLRWIYVGTGVSTLVLFACSIWSMVTLAKVAAPPTPPAVTIDIVGHQWWWEARYRGVPAQRSFTTANELHIPVGQPVRLQLTGQDVIHSFWVPQLAGKTDVIPGLTNVAWLQADKPGVYYGQCTEYCGHQHAHMGVIVVAESPQAFATWWDHQLSASPPPQGIAQQGRQAFMEHCATCHSIRGTLAGGILGPDLSHLKQRRRIPSGQMENTPETLADWIAHPQSIKPGALMPDPALDANQRKSILAFLETLD
jgi:cytochrome c oxidase subunit II